MLLHSLVAPLKAISISAVFMGIVSCLSAPYVQAADQPNIVLILADDLGYADVGYHETNNSEVLTPNIDLLAKNSTFFTAGYAMAPVCAPSRAGLLTGRYQNRFGFEDNPGGRFRKNAQVKPGIPKSEINLGELLQQQGYATAWIGKDHQGKDNDFHPNNRGFEQFFGFVDGATSYFPDKDKNSILQRNRVNITEKEYLTDAFGREAVSFIKKNAEQPFFLYLPFNAVHGPLEAKPADLKVFSHVKNESRRTMLAMNYAMDRSIGMVRDTLAELNLLDNTLIIFYSDNGGKPVKGNASLNTPLKGQKGTLMEGGIRVPFFMHWPKNIAKANQVDFPIAAIDIYPTVVAAVATATREKITVKNPLDGINLLPYLTEEKQKPKARNIYWRFLYQWAVRDDEWKLVKLKGKKKIELYHLSEDISEQHNVYKKHPEVVKRLTADYKAWSATMMAPQWSWQPKYGGKYVVPKITSK